MIFDILTPPWGFWVPVGGGGGVFWYFLAYVGWGHFLGGSKFLNFNIFLGLQKINYFWVWNFVDFFGGHHKIGLYLGVISCILGSFLKVKVQKRGYVLGLLKFQINFWGAWNFWYFWGWTLDAWPEPTYEEKKRVPPGFWGRFHAPFEWVTHTQNLVGFYPMI